MNRYIPGQRWMSEAEPELGLGMVLKVEDKQITLAFKASDTQRVYGANTAPLKRVKFEEGDKIRSREGIELSIEEVVEEEGLIFYVGHGKSLCELDLEDAMSFARPEEKVLGGQVDTEEFFNLRMETLARKKNWELSPVKGLMGGRISLIAHQLYLAHKICQRPHPRVLLADEVGLGKTIEAGLIIHQMVTSSRAQRVLVLVPDSLVYQWFFELHRKFQLGFAVINQETYLEKGQNPFLDNERMVVSIGLLKGSEVAQELLAQAEFDILVVDEAHRYAKENAAFEYNLLEELSQRIPSLLLLTATPEQLGMEGHFQRLRLLDSDRFSSYEDFKNEVHEFGEVADIARKISSEGHLEKTEIEKLKEWMSEQDFSLLENLTDENREKLLSHLIDSHGTGRVFFRNTRSAMRKEYDFFPDRLLHPYPLETDKKIETSDEIENAGASFKLKANWLLEFFSKCDEKVLLICHSKKKVLWLEKFIRENATQIKAGVFHSGLSLMARDRQAAYFADPDGANLLMCTEIGSEGRNFEFAHHLILLDLPKKPDLLEQRIGRLDRIGQKADIQIHVPFVKNSWEEDLFHLYHEGLNCFEKFSSVGTPVFVHFHERVHSLLEGNEDKQLAGEMAEFSKKLEEELEQSRDFLIELNSFDSEKSKSLISQIQNFEGSRDLKNYMESAFECFGVDSEELNPYVSFIKPNDNMFIPHFPQLDHHGKSITYDRREALEREEYTFLNEDHPMVREVSDLILSEGFGNATVATRKSGGGKKSFLEAFFIFETSASPHFELNRWLPTTVIRVLIDKDGADFSEKWSKDLLDGKLTGATAELAERASKMPKSLMKKLVDFAHEKANEKAKPIFDAAMGKLEIDSKEEIERLEHLSKTNKSISKNEILIMNALFEKRREFLKKANLRLDSIRLIF